MKRPAFQFYGGDWLRDPGLRACSLTARGLWIDMISIMSQVEEPYGYLVFAARKDGDKDGHKDILTPILPGVLARMVGASEGEVSQLLDELESFGVFSRTAEGVIFSRRMVRDEKVRQSRASGGFQSLENPNVPKKKDGAKDRSKAAGRISFEGSLGGSPAFAFASALNTLSESDLEDVYKAYPVHKARGSALKAIEKAAARVAKKDGISKSEALSKLKSRVETYARLEKSKGTDSQYIPLPATWFNAERYDDDELVTPPGEQQRSALTYRDPASLYEGPEYVAERRPA